MSAPATAFVSLLGLDPGAYRSHPLHAPERTYMEINCYTDILVELLHARGEEPLAAMGGTLQMDFEGDQWTFFKPAPEDLELLYGMDIHEMQPYRPLPAQIAEQIARERTVAVEVDSGTCPTRRRPATAPSTSRPRSSPRRSTRRTSGCTTSTRPACTS